jgi:hypothetical protein
MIEEVEKHDNPEVAGHLIHCAGTEKITFLALQVLTENFIKSVSVFERFLLTAKKVQFFVPQRNNKIIPVETFNRNCKRLLNTIQETLHEIDDLSVEEKRITLIKGLESYKILLELFNGVLQCVQQSATN